MHGTEVRIVDANDEGIGEIICRGPSVMLGYYEDPEATAEVIRDGWLYTGDLGYMDERGFLYVTGRKKTVIVTKGGKNIFPEEIEEVIKKNPSCRITILYSASCSVVSSVASADSNLSGDWNRHEKQFGFLKLHSLRVTINIIRRLYTNLLMQQGIKVGLQEIWTVALGARNTLLKSLLRKLQAVL